MPAEPVSQQSVIAQAVALLDHYAFDTGRLPCTEVARQWLERYEPAWIRAAAIEALYLGRYKAVSVAQILEIWQRRGQPTPHFNGDFERLICRKLPDYFAAPGDALDLALDLGLTLDPRARAASSSSLLDPRALPLASRSPQAVPTAERSPDPARSLLVVPARSTTALHNADPFRSPIRIYSPPVDTSEFYARLCRFLARSLALTPPALPSERPEEWVLELGMWHLELDEGTEASPQGSETPGTSEPPPEPESTAAEPCDCT